MDKSTESQNIKSERSGKVTKESGGESNQERGGENRQLKKRNGSAAKGPIETHRSEKTHRTQISNNNDKNKQTRPVRPTNTRKEIVFPRKMSSLNQFKLVSNLGDGAYSKVFKVKRIADG